MLCHMVSYKQAKLLPDYTVKNPSTPQTSSLTNKMSLVTFCVELEVLTDDYEEDDLLGYNTIQLGKAHQHFAEIYCLHFQGQRASQVGNQQNAR